MGFARHAMALDEKRGPYGIYRFDPDTVAGSAGRYQEQWFVGVHSDVGGQFPDDHELSDIAFSWMVKEAAHADFRVNKQKYNWMLNSRFDDELPANRAMGKIHHADRLWWLAGGWNHREILRHDTLHPSVQYRLDHDKNYSVSRK